MKSQRDLKISLQERYKRVYAAPSGTFENEVRYFWDYLQARPLLRALIDEVERFAPAFDAAAWFQAQTNDDYDRRGDLGWPDTESERAKVLVWLTRQFVEKKLHPEAFGHYVSFESNSDAVLKAVTDRVFRPLVEHLQDRLSEELDSIYVLDRYKKRLEWFEQDRLFQAFKADTAHGEEIYDKDLRRALFEEGIDNPFSKPRSASGEADVVAGLETDDPFVCELKLYDAASYNVAYVAKGLKQALRYARDYNKHAAFLVTINLSDEVLQLPTDDPGKPWPPRLHVGEHVVYLVVVQGKPLPTASARGKAKVRVVSRDEMVSVVEE